MPLYQLFAAKDGCVFQATATCDDDMTAERWASERIADEFQLETRDFDFDEAAACCDGVMLEPVRLPLEALAEEWASAQMIVLGLLGKLLGPSLYAERRRLVLALVEFANAAAG